MVFVAVVVTAFLGAASGVRGPGVGKGNGWERGTCGVRAPCGDDLSSNVNYSLREIYLDIDMYLDVDIFFPPSHLLSLPVRVLCVSVFDTSPTPCLAALGGWPD